MALINVDYEEAINQVGKLRRTVQNCGNIVTTTRKQIDALPSAWQGEGATAMAERMTAWLSELQAIQADINDMASRIKNAAEAMKNADDASAQSIRSGR